jgi:hypothetical protein
MRVKAMIDIVHGPDASYDDTHVLVRSTLGLIYINALKPDLPAPHLTEKGLALRAMVLEMNEDQAKIVRSL